MAEARRAVTNEKLLDELQARVTTVFDDLHLPTWPDPHPGGASPSDDEYSRLTDPERYRVGRARAQVWAAVLIDELGARQETLMPSAADDTDGFDRGVRLLSPEPGTLSLILLERDVPTVTEAVLPVLQIAVQSSDLVLDAVVAG